MTQTAVEQPFQIDQYIMHHVLNSQEWHILGFTIHLPHYLSLHAVMVLLSTAILLVLFCSAYNKEARVPTGITNALEAFVQFIRDEIALPSLGEEDGTRLTPMLCTMFFYILVLNLIGLIPIFSTATANINVTFALGFLSFLLMSFGAIAKNGVGGFFKAFVPSNVPWPVLIILVPIEFLSLFIKSGALMIRLFANMLAGHMVVLSFLGLIIMLGWVALPAVVLAICISAMEVFVAVLQAYIFTLLSAVFIGQMYHPEH